MNAQEALEIIKDKLPFTIGVIKEALDLVEKCANKQIPKKLPVIEELYHCPVCGEKDAILQGDKYCFNCGQALDWSDTE